MRFVLVAFVVTLSFSCSPPCEGACGAGGGSGATGGGSAATGGGANATGGGSGATGGGSSAMGGGSSATGGGSGATGGGSGATGGGSGATGGGSGATGGGSGLPSATATQVAVGSVHSCALTTGGAVRCWGAEDHGVLGNGETSTSNLQPSPVQVTGLTSGVTAIAAFSFDTCAVVSGAAKCWGDNSDGQLGADPMTTTDSNVPVQIPNLTTEVTAIGVGEAHACAVKNGGVWCWGKNDYGQLGDNGMEDNSPTPVQVMGITSGATAVACGRWHSCAIVNGGLKCWGSNLYGEMGIGMSGTGQHAPVTPTGLSMNVTAMGLGGNTTCVVQSGAAKCFGNNDDGECGNGMSGVGEECDSPTQVSGLSSAVTDISAGWYSSCAVIASGVKCWGYNLELTLGNGQSPSFTSNVPVAASTLTTGVAHLAGGATNHVCAVTTAGHVYCWGSADPYLGDGDGTTDRPAPEPVVSLP